ncbi:coiled-coil domain-containing protein 151 [Lingula anatina]|uniref:Coiled-coil domain-containing protein 151 n=1 Tax=Lingula anatina TaxID=7574 RepID=A0A1S3JQG1_LINAN|nr:coiled-coil domain-containing protein 151 [Lingula anatina]|eukprot:XP_013412590.1 coiled-coil domain-containing protein 151 [Lingula anatina]
MAQRAITEHIEEVKSKIALLEGDRKAYYENSQWTMKQNRDTIEKLRKENWELRKKLSDCLSADDHVINKAFHGRKVERAAMKNKTGSNAITIMDRKVCDYIKKLNALKHVTATKQKRLEELQTQYNQMVKDASDAVATDAGESEAAANLRNLENRLDKAVLKCNEAEQIRRTYEQIKSKLEEESLSFPNQLDAMEAEIKRCREELKELRAMYNDAHISKEAAQAELHKHEEVVYADRKKREIELQKMKKEAEEKKMQHERTEKRIAQRGSLQQDELSPSEKAAILGEDQQAKITTYEEAFKRIKEATGVSDTKEVVDRFENQGETQRHLEELKKDSEKQIQRLREEKEKLQQEFEDMKYTGEAKLSSGQRLLEEFETHLAEEERRKEEAGERLDKASKILVSVKAGVEHLSDKLTHLKANKGHVPQAQISATSDEYVLDLLSTAEEKLLKLLEDLDGKDISEALKLMEEEEFHASIEGKLPSYNTRIKLPVTHKDNVYDDEDESGDDDGDVLTRNLIKRQAQNMIDAKTKRKMGGKRKKKTK